MSFFVCFDKIFQLIDAPNLIRQILNITQSDYYLIHGHNLELLLDFLYRLTNEPFSLDLHLKDSDYTQKILATFDQLSDQAMSQNQFNVLLARLYEYGKELSIKHAQMPYLRPFVYKGRLIGEFLEKKV